MIDDQKTYKALLLHYLKSFYKQRHVWLLEKLKKRWKELEMEIHLNYLKVFVSKKDLEMNGMSNLGNAWLLKNFLIVRIYY